MEEPVRFCEKRCGRCGDGTSRAAPTGAAAGSKKP
jgi:hypothetical protein